MNPVRVLVLVIAAVAAIGLAFVLRGVLAGKDKPVAAPVASAAAPDKPMVRVLIAKRDLPTGTRLVAADLDWQAWPADGVNPAFITDGAATPESATEKAARVATQTLGSGRGADAIKRIEGAVVREPILANEPVTTRKIVRGGEGGYMSVVLDPGMRAMAVSVTVDTAAGGFILPGDRVDVLQSVEKDEKMLTRTVMRNVKVLAIDQAAKPEKDANTLVGAVATLEVPAGDTEVLANAQIEARSGGALVLALRSYADTYGGSSRGGGVSDAAGSISLFKGGEGSEVTVSR